MGRHADGVVAPVERYELRLEHDVAVDLEIGCDGLKTAEASCTQISLAKIQIQIQVQGVVRRGRGLTRASFINRGEVDIVTPDSCHIYSSNIDSQIRQLRITGESHASDSLVVDCASNLAVVSVDDGGVGKHEGSSGISDGLASSDVHRSPGPDLELGGRELPEAVGGVDGRPSEGAAELGGVDGAEGVGAYGGLAEIGGEDGHGEGGLGVVEEGLLLRGLDGVELRVGEANKSIGLRVLDEGR